MIKIGLCGVEQRDTGRDIAYSYECPMQFDSPVPVFSLAVFVGVNAPLHLMFCYCFMKILCG